MNVMNVIKTTTNGNTITLTGAIKMKFEGKKNVERTLNKKGYTLFATKDINNDVESFYIR